MQKCSSSTKGIEYVGTNRREVNETHKRLGNETAKRSRSEIRCQPKDKCSLCTFKTKRCFISKESIILPCPCYSNPSFYGRFLFCLPDLLIPNLRRGRSPPLLSFPSTSLDRIQERLTSTRRISSIDGRMDDGPHRRGTYQALQCLRDGVNISGMIADPQICGFNLCREERVECVIRFRCQRQF
jgi:hypothetical protein